MRTYYSHDNVPSTRIAQNGGHEGLCMELRLWEPGKVPNASLQAPTRCVSTSMRGASKPVKILSLGVDLCVDVARGMHEFPNT